MSWPKTPRFSSDLDLKSNKVVSTDGDAAAISNLSLTSNSTQLTIKFQQVELETLHGNAQSHSTTAIFWSCWAYSEDGSYSNRQIPTLVSPNRERNHQDRTGTCDGFKEFSILG